MKKNKVLHVFAGLECGGAESRTVDIYRKIDRDKCQFAFLVVKPYKNSYFKQQILRMGGEIFKPADPNNNLLKNLIDLIRIIKQRGPFVAVHSHVSYYSGIVLLAAKLAGVKIRVAHARTSNTNQLSFKKNIFMLLGKLLIKCFANRRLAVSKLASDFLFDSCKKSTILPNSIDLQKYWRINLHKSSYSYFSGKKTILMVARFEKMKNHRFAVEVLSELLNNYNNNVCLLFAGYGPLQKSIEEQVSSLKLDNHVHFLGAVTELGALYNLADIVILPSLYEGLPNVVLEAQASSSPCLVSSSITQEVDMGLGLVHFLPLNNKKLWAEKINEFFNITKKKLSEEKIYLKFKQHGFTFSNTINILEKTYGIKLR